MQISQSTLAYLYLYALLLGGAAGAFYDLLRITRIFLGMHYSRCAASRLQQIKLPYLPTKRRRGESRLLGLLIFLEDLLFCLLAGVAMILLFYELNNGKVRLPALLCAVAGFFLYRATLGRLVMLSSEILAFAVETTARYLLFFICLPIRFLVRLVVGRVKRIAALTERRYRKGQRQRRTAAETERIKRNACGLIPEDLPRQRKWKRGKKIGKSTQKAIQPEHSDARAARRHGRGVDRRVCK